MKLAYRMFSALCLLAAFVSLSGCADSVAPPSPTDDVTAEQTEVQRFDARDIAGLKLGEFLRFDAARPNTVYVLTYSDPADLDHVLVDRGTDKYILGERASADAKGAGPKQIVVSFEDSIIEQPTDGDTVCNCPCCQLVNGAKVCC